MFRLVLTDEEIPGNVAKMKFYYTGGSSTFSPASGVGCVNSKQTEYRTVADDGVYEIYTMPHTEEDVLTKLTVTALDANDNIIKERIFEDVPVVRNQVTRPTTSRSARPSAALGPTRSTSCCAPWPWSPSPRSNFLRKKIRSTDYKD